MNSKRWVWALASYSIFGLIACASESARKEESPKSNTNVEATGDTVPCPCAAFGAHYRAKVQALHGTRATLTALEFVGGTEGGSTMEQGPIEVALESGLPCYAGQLNVQIGDDVLAVLWNTCETNKSCSSPSVSAKLTPWKETIVFAEGNGERLSVPAANLEELWALPLSECVEKYGDWTDLTRSDNP